MYDMFAKNMPILTGFECLLLRNL